MEPQEPGTDVEPVVEVCLDVAADADQVWEALTTDGGLAPWMGEGATIEPRPDGLVVAPDPVGGVTRRGRVEWADPGRRLDFTWWPALRPAERSRVSITVTPLDEGSRVRVVERPCGPVAAPVPRPVAWRTAGVVGAWSWRLALLSITCTLARI